LSDALEKKLRYDKDGALGRFCDEKHRPTRQSPNANKHNRMDVGIGAGLAIGAGFGVALGLAPDNLSLGIVAAVAVLLVR
jgi:hypothetical protein